MTPSHVCSLEPAYDSDQNLINGYDDCKISSEEAGYLKVEVGIGRAKSKNPQFLIKLAKVDNVFPGLEADLVKASRPIELP